MNKKNVSVVMFTTLIVFTVIISSVGPFLSCVPVKEILACTGTEAVLSRDYILNGNQTGVVYRDYPLEYPFMSGAFIQFVNTLANYTDVILGQLFFTSILLGLISVGILILYFKIGVSWKRAALFYTMAPISLAFTWLETLQMFLFLMGLVLFEKKREGIAGVFLGLSTGIKYLPLLTLPFFYQKAQKKWVITASWIGTFAVGMMLEILLSPTNFMRGMSFYSGYGIEGSWLGLLYGHVIDYRQETFYIGQSTVFHLPQVYQIVSGVLMLGALSGIWRSKYNLVEKVMLVFVAEICLLWLSAPQFLINVAVLLPLITKIKLSIRSVSMWWITGILGFFPFIVLVAQIFPTFTAAYYLQIVLEIMLAVFISVEFLLKK